MKIIQTPSQIRMGVDAKLKTQVDKKFHYSSIRRILYQKLNSRLWPIFAEQFMLKINQKLDNGT